MHASRRLAALALAALAACGPAIPDAADARADSGVAGDTAATTVAATQDEFWGRLTALCGNVR